MHINWLPLFNNNINAPTHFVNNKVNYKLKGNVEELEAQLEKQIKKKVTKLRQLDRTIWNHNLANIFKNALKSFEIHHMYNKNHFETISELNDQLSSFNVSITFK
ncbi:hypothetical protein NQ314_018891 [Rhamnusium bicolor]|uniref:Centrosomal protein of 76 kDa C-terminal domain-containing protein n=1 Tax=Rhamnusium bicolor TaxID=1586634 RepID=A0AAV8WPU3_9CUCU|nr:hypothetical protein NQ314_018891 [Rhamnusium bicolor]